MYTYVYMYAYVNIFVYVYVIYIIPGFAGSNPNDIDNLFQFMKFWAQILRVGVKIIGPEGEIFWLVAKPKARKVGLWEKCFSYYLDDSFIICYPTL